MRDFEKDNQEWRSKRARDIAVNENKDNDQTMDDLKTVEENPISI